MFCKSVDGRKIYYEVHGNLGSAETIVFLNGLTQSTLAWVLFLPHFKSRFRIILMDFIFQGQSDSAPEWRNFDAHARDVYSVLESMQVAEAHIAGISYGSLVAQHFAINHRERLTKLVLLSTFAHKTPYYEAVELSWWRALEAGGYGLMLDIMLPSVLSENYFSHPLVPIRKIKEARREINLNAENIFKLMQATRQRPDFRKELKKIAAPCLIIQGEKDLLFPVHMAEEVQKNIRRSRLVVIKDAGHTLNLEHVPEVCRYIISFLDEVEQ